MTAAQDAMRRAARYLPTMMDLRLYVRSTDPVHNRPAPNTFTPTERVRGSLRWRDVDQISQLAAAGREVGDGVAVLVAPVGPVPDLIQTAAGDFLLVAGAAGRDSLGLSVKLAVSRWSGPARSSFPPHERPHS